ncbi:unnamed protein product [Pylaiella littoralis]
MCSISILLKAARRDCKCVSVSDQCCGITWRLSALWYTLLRSPSQVLPESRRQSYGIWTLLIFGIVGYIGYICFNAVEKMKDPDVSFSLSNDGYTYPDLNVCMYDWGAGCDTGVLPEDCVFSSNSTEGGIAGGYYFGENNGTIPTWARLTEDRGWCVTFFMSQIDNRVGMARNPEDYGDFSILDLSWYPGGAANKSNTCTAQSDEGIWEDHSGTVVIHLEDPASNDFVVSTGLQASYSCVTSTSNRLLQTEVRLGLTRTKLLGGEVTNSYKVATTSTYNYYTSRNASIEAPYASMKLNIKQGPNSLENLTEIDPVSIAEFLGNVGGFWDLLLLLLPIFLVSTLQQDPHLQVRNLRKTASQGVEMVRRLNFKSKDRVGQEGFGDLNVEQTPSWDCQRPIEQVLPTSRPVVGVFPSTPSLRAARSPARSPEPRKIPAASP